MIRKIHTQNSCYQVQDIQNEIIYVCVGQGGDAGMNETTFNNGTSTNGGHNGGGSTDIRYFGNHTPSEEELKWNSTLGINSRIMVAGGGGSANLTTGGVPGAGGLLIAANGRTSRSKGGTQTSFENSETVYPSSAFGIANGGCTGGNGYYPGAGAQCAYGSGGGSSFISGYAGVNAITSETNRTHTNNTLHYSGKYFIDGQMSAGVNEGHGKARISFISSTKPERTTTKLNNVRYIKDCINGNTSNNENHWGEIQAIKDGINIAKGKTVTGTTAQYNNTNYAYSNIVDGKMDNMISSGGYGYTASTGNQCVTIDLGSTYNLDEISVWHYYDDGRTYKNNITSVSSDNTNWTEVINKQEVESVQGKRVSAYRKNVNNCTYEGELVQGAEYVNGQYTYRYKQVFVGNGVTDDWLNSEDTWWDLSNSENTKWYVPNIDGWGVTLTNKNSTDPVTTKLCTSINGKPIAYMQYMFAKSNATSLDLSSFDTSNVVDMYAMFYNSKATTLDLSNFNTSNVTNMHSMFANAEATSLDLSSFNTSKVIDMANMFDSVKINNLDLSSFDTSNVTTMRSMFAGGETTRIIGLNNFNTSKVTNMANMFYFSKFESLDISSFDTRNVTNMSYMFGNASALNLDLSNFDTSNVTTMSKMFDYANAVTINGLTNFDTSKVVDMSSMFGGTKVSTLDLSSFDTNKVTNFNWIFSGATATTGYARTQADADKFNSSSGKPSTLTFTVKN